MEPEIPRRRRPFGVIVVALLQLGTIIVAFSSYLWDANLPWEGGLAELLAEHSWARVAILLFGVLVVLAAAGMWRLQRWGWALMILLVAMSLVLDLSMWYRAGEADRHLALYLRMVLDIVSAFYLNSSAVQVAFRGRQADASAPAQTTSAAGRIDP